MWARWAPYLTQVQPQGTGLVGKSQWFTSLLCRRITRGILTNTDARIMPTTHEIRCWRCLKEVHFSLRRVGSCRFKTSEAMTLPWELGVGSVPWMLAAKVCRTQALFGGWGRAGDGHPGKGQHLNLQGVSSKSPLDAVDRILVSLEG